MRMRACYIPCSWQLSLRWSLFRHTWGKPGIFCGNGCGQNTYNKRQFLSELASNESLNSTIPGTWIRPYADAASTWAEQRIFNELAVQALEHAAHPIAKDVRARVDALSNVRAPNLFGMTKIAAGSWTEPILLGGVRVRFDVTGAISSLQAGSVEWASAAHPLAQYIYQTLNDTEWIPWAYDYMNGHTQQWTLAKLGSNNYSESAIFTPTLTALYTAGATVVAELSMPRRANELYGCPATAYLNVPASQAPFSH